jgi:poly-gamma-glutamate synthesis protein (capsule biosynthesis protein)
MINVEGVVGEPSGGFIDKDGPPLRISPDCLSMLSAVPVTVACLANNHTVDYGLDGLAETIERLEHAGLATVGADLDAERAVRPYRVRVSGTSVAVVNIAEGEEARSRGGYGVAALDLSAASERIQQLKTEQAVVIVVVHAGVEHLPVPPPHIRTQYRALAAAGADVVIGHHPHVIQGYEVFRGVPIFYSLGNFLCWFDPHTRDEETAFAVRARFRGRWLDCCELWPYRIRADGLAALDSDGLEEFWRRFLRSSNSLADDEAILLEWRESARRWVETKGLDDLLAATLELTPPRMRAASCLRSLAGSLSAHGAATRLLRRALVALTAAVARPEQVRERPATESSRQAAARLRNRFDTLSHQALYRDGLSQLLETDRDAAPQPVGGAQIEGCR